MMNFEFIDGFVFPTDQTLIASKGETLEDYLKSCGCRDRHIHCSFSLEKFDYDLDKLEKELKQVGAKSIAFNSYVAFIGSDEPS